MSAHSGPASSSDAAPAEAVPGPVVAPPMQGSAWQTIGSVSALLILWAVAAAFAGSRLLPGPLEVASTLVSEALHGPLLEHLGITLARVGVSFLVAMALGTALGVWLGRSATADRWLYPWVVVLLNVPALVVIILTYVWLGLVELAVLVAVALNKIPNVAVTLREGAHSMERDFSEVALVYRFGRWRTLRQVVLPQLAPFLLAATRNGLALIWKIVLVVELLGRSNGIGFQLHGYFQLFDVTRLLAYSLAFVACVLLIEWGALIPLERRLAVWRR